MNDASRHDYDCEYCRAPACRVVAALRAHPEDCAIYATANGEVWAERVDLYRVWACGNIEAMTTDCQGCWGCPDNEPGWTREHGGFLGYITAKPAPETTKQALEWGASELARRLGLGKTA